VTPHNRNLNMNTKIVLPGCQKEPIQADRLCFKKLSWCWQTRATRLVVSRGHQTWYHSIC